MVASGRVDAEGVLTGCGLRWATEDTSRVESPAAVSMLGHGVVLIFV
jgi:hypothetical protein